MVADSSINSDSSSSSSSDSSSSSSSSSTNSDNGIIDSSSGGGCCHQKRQQPSPPPLIVGHRGALYNELENTRESFLSSYALGADAIELDVFLLKDGWLIVFHGGGTDDNAGDLSDYCILGGGKDTVATNIKDLNFEECQQLVFNPDHDVFPCTVEKYKIMKGKIPTLEEVLIDAKTYQKKVKIELKGPGTVPPVLELVEKLKVQHLCTYSSFDLSMVRLLRDLRPEQQHHHQQQHQHQYQQQEYPTGALFSNPVPDDYIQQAKNAGVNEVHLRYDTCTKNRVNEIHNAGMNSMAWFRGPVGMNQARFLDVGNEDERMYETVAATGVRQMCVNRPDVLFGMSQQQQQQQQHYYVSESSPSSSSLLSLQQ